MHTRNGGTLTIGARPVMVAAGMPPAMLRLADSTTREPGAAPKLRRLASPAVRADAYRRLESVADYLETLEPHSPVPRLVRRAVAWGNMSFHQLLVELTHNNNEMQKLLVRGPVG